MVKWVMGCGCPAACWRGPTSSSTCKGVVFCITPSSQQDTSVSTMPWCADSVLTVIGKVILKIIKSSPVQSSPVQSSPVQSSP